MAWNKELTQGSGMGVDSYGTRAAGDITKAARIGNHLMIGNSSGIDWEQRRLLNHEGESYTGAEGRRSEQDSDRRSYQMKAGHRIHVRSLI